MISALSFQPYCLKLSRALASPKEPPYFEYQTQHCLPFFGCPNEEFEETVEQKDR